MIRFLAGVKLWSAGCAGLRVKRASLHKIAVWRTNDGRAYLAQVGEASNAGGCQALNRTAAACPFRDRTDQGYRIQNKK
jgi:hypothetical protein